MDQLADPKARVVGLKQTLRALEAGRVKMVYVALDADPALRERMVALCGAYGIELIPVPDMARLGEACGIQVGAATAALLR